MCHFFFKGENVEFQIFNLKYALVFLELSVQISENSINNEVDIISSPFVAYF